MPLRDDPNSRMYMHCAHEATVRLLDCLGTGSSEPVYTPGEPYEPWREFKKNGFEIELPEYTEG